VPGGFGERGAEGKVKAIEHARQNKSHSSGSVWGCRWPLWNMQEMFVVSTTHVPANSGLKVKSVIHLMENQGYRPQRQDDASRIAMRLKGTSAQKGLWG
jgi:CTP synthase (UTP-ammonia lyase)